MGLFSSSDESEHEKIVSRGGFREATTINTAQKRVIDEEAGVVLYAAMSPKQGLGLAAVPIEVADSRSESTSRSRFARRTCEDTDLELDDGGEENDEE